MLNELRDAGLSDNEAKTYLAMLELGPATILQIAAKAGINRPTAYVQVESLKRRGLVTVQTKGKRSLFVPESPAQLESMLERQAKDVELRKERLSGALPELTAMYNLGELKPVVRFFEGIAGLRKMQDDFLKSREKVLYGISNLDQVLKVFPQQRKEYTAMRIAKGIRTRFIYTSVKGKIFPAIEPEALRESRYIAPHRLPYTADISIWDDNVGIASLSGRLFGTIITQREVADSFKGLFELLWQAGE